MYGPLHILLMGGAIISGSSDRSIRAWDAEPVPKLGSLWRGIPRIYIPLPALAMGGTSLDRLTIPFESGALRLVPQLGSLLVGHTGYVRVCCETAPHIFEAAACGPCDSQGFRVEPEELCYIVPSWT